MEQKEKKSSNSITRRISRRQALKAGGIAALGLVFTTPRIDTITPKAVSANVSPVTPPTTDPCTAFIDATASAILGAGTNGSSIPSGSTNTYDAAVTFDCGSCSAGACTPSLQYSWSSESTNSLTVQIANPSSPSTDVTPVLNLGGSGFGMADYILRCTVTLTCGSGPCQDTAQIVLSTKINVFA